MKKDFTVTVIIPTFRRLDMLILSLEGVYSMERTPHQVIVVYRPHDDPQAENWLKNTAVNKYPLIQLEPIFRPGVVAALNLGLSKAESEIIAIFDDDAVPRYDWLSKITSHYLSEQVGAVGGRDIIHQHKPTKKTNKAGYRDFWGNIIGNHHIVTGSAREVEVLKGCNWSFRKAAIGSLHLDDRLLGNGAQHANDYWFCLNLRHNNWKIVLDPEAIVDHYPAPRPDHIRNEWHKVKCYEQTRNEVATQVAFLPCNMKIRFPIYYLLVGHRNCPGLYFIAHSLLKRPKDLIGQFIGGWTGFIAGWKAAKEFRVNPPGIPNKPPL